MLTAGFRAISVPFTLHYIEKTVKRALYCALSCCVYVYTEVRVLPEEPFFQWLTLRCALFALRLHEMQAARP